MSWQKLTVAYQRTGLWNDWTNRSYAHWLSVYAGFGLHSGKELIRIGEAVETMPAIRTGFACGELSYDKVALITEVAVPEDETLWARLANAVWSIVTSPPPPRQPGR